MTTYKDNFAIFILTHNRPDKIETITTLGRKGCTAKIYLIVDDLDPSLELYKSSYPADQLLIFSKEKYRGTFDIGDNHRDLRGVAYARNAVFDIAQGLGIEYFLVLDDDYKQFQYKFDGDLNFKSREALEIDPVFCSFLEFFENNKQISSIALAQGGDFIGGAKSSSAKSVKLKRKCMNSFFLSTKRRFDVVGTFNDDVNTYVIHGSRGKIFFTANHVAIVPGLTQINSGGLTELYLDSGTYVKSFYTVMFHPSSVTIRTMGRYDRRIHHSINWKCTVPMILREKHRKATIDNV